VTSFTSACTNIISPFLSYVTMVYQLLSLFIVESVKWLIMYGDVIGRTWPYNSHSCEGTENSEDPVKITALQLRFEPATSYISVSRQSRMWLGGGGGGCPRPRASISRNKQQTYFLCTILALSMAKSYVRSLNSNS
jgi:hypothetical protein